MSPEETVKHMITDRPYTSTLICCGASIYIDPRNERPREPEHKEWCEKRKP